jgi:pimeloyl-ACP methyl ester carboxylesterase
MLILGEKDPVLGYRRNQISNSKYYYKLVTFPDGHMSHIENQEQLADGLVSFLRKFKTCLK